MTTALAKPTAAQTTEIVEDPRWDEVRTTASQLAVTGRMWLRGQVRLGMLLAALKKDLDVHRGRPKKNSDKLSELLPWPELVEQKTGYTSRTCDRFIDLYEATVAKLKKTKAKLLGDVVNKKTALMLFDAGGITKLTDKQWEIVDSAIASLTDGETQASLMVELGVLPKPAKMPKGGGKKGEKLSLEQLAFAFFDSPLSAILETRQSTDYKKLLHILPPTSDDPSKPSLVLMRDEMAAMVDDINEALADRTKQAKGKVVR